MRADLTKEARPGSGETRETPPGLGDVLDDLYKVIADREQTQPDGSYTTYLFNSGLDKILKKIAEEAGEVIIASKNDSSERIAEETADLLYHLLVLLCDRGIPLTQVRDELTKRRAEKTQSGPAPLG